MRAILPVFLTTICFSFLKGQIGTNAKEQRERTTTQFEFTQIDSLVEQAIRSTLATDSHSTIVAFTKWFIGGRNPFDIYILNYSDKKCRIQKIDNTGYSKIQKVNASTVIDFITSHLDEMQSEKLTPKIDTTYTADGNVITTQTFIDHQLLEKITIVSRHSRLGYEYPANYSDNKYNLLTYRFKFLSLMRELPSP